VLIAGVLVAWPFSWRRIASADFPYLSEGRARECYSPLILEALLPDVWKPSVACQAAFRGRTSSATCDGSSAGVCLAYLYCICGTPWRWARFRCYRQRLRCMGTLQPMVFLNGCLPLQIMWRPIPSPRTRLPRVGYRPLTWSRSTVPQPIIPPDAAR
jgi:hypothetical protein